MPQLVVDKQTDAAYLYLGDSNEKRIVSDTQPLLPDDRGGMVNMDFDENGYLVGIELIPASLYLRERDTEGAVDAH